MKILQVVTEFLKRQKDVATFILLVLLTCLVSVWIQTGGLRHIQASDTQAQTAPSILGNDDELKQSFELRYFISGSMEPNVQVNDRILIDKTSYLAAPPQRGDVVLFLPPSAKLGANFSKDLVDVKRVVGLPGEAIEIKNQQVFINGQSRAEAKLPKRLTYDQTSFVLAEDTYYVLGDNPNSSLDSRVWGPLSRANITGKVLGILCPPSRQTLLDPSAPLSEEAQQVWSVGKEFFQQSYQSRGSCNASPSKLGRIKSLIYAEL